ncbi:saccharopine dehydrogenase NADP-binding domain-containing protein [Streptomyces sp. NBC_00670]|uniref:saccharopine dehydrogenase NADP-binding domain-containing protein n=1 Tax=Streptomyces sp. NBC_00670 TaxID=2975804 RepID=UPI002E30B2C5|nr:saccharopine dehydrogenase NADP-binding domain-containing protein [Streptomyces sp. NBC_00670]
MSEKTGRPGTESGAAGAAGDGGGIWILGGTGRVGRAVAARLMARGLSPVLVGRDAGRLREAAGQVGGDPRTVVAPTLEETKAALAREAPAVIVNTIGPFTTTAVPLVRACPPGTHYLDLSNELTSIRQVLDLHDEAVAAGSTLVPGAGFGVCATESAVRKVCEGRPPAERLRVDAVPSVRTEPGPLGEALAASLVDGVTVGGRRYERGRLVRTRIGAGVERFTLPDGSAARAMALPAGDLEAAHRASGAPYVTAGNAEIPSALMVRALLPVVAAVLSRPAIGNAAKRRLARVRATAREAPRPHSWARARATWPDGTTHEMWLRTGEAMEFTTRLAAEVATRLSRGEAAPGASTPATLFGPGLAEAAGAGFLTGGVTSASV